MFVVLDTNIWLSEFGLRSPLGAVTRLFIRQKNARIALPAVVRLEAEHQFRYQLRDFIAKLHDNHRQLLTIFGSLKELVLPDDAAVEGKVVEIFTNVGVDLVEIPFSLPSARSSFLKTIDKVPPSDKTQEFKDGVLWADCVALLQDDDVSFVSRDKAFYQGRDFSKGLSANLAGEIRGAPHSLTLFSSLSDLLISVRTRVPIDDNLLVQTFLTKHRESIDDVLTGNGFQLGHSRQVSKILYATENPSIVSIEFTIEYEATEVAGDGRMNGILTLRGDGVFETKSGTFNELRNFGEHLTFQLSDGSTREVRNQVAFGGTITLGHKQVTHSVRHKLE